MASLQLSNLSKSFNQTKVLEGLNLMVPEGEFIALIGPSGCGKSTLLRIIAGLDEPTSGDVLLDGQWVNELSPRERKVAMVFQSYALYPHMTVFENIGFNLKISKIPRQEIRQRVTQTAAILDLEELLERKPSQLSGGQRQRVAMGRAIVRNPNLFLFDEPLSNLDAKLRVQMRDEIKKLHKAIKTTSIYVTHDQVEAMTLADRIVILNDGVIQQIGTPQQLYNTPVNPFVAGFIGSPSMNFLNGKWEDDHKTAIILKDGTKLPAPVPKSNTHFDASTQNDILIGMRPEHLHLRPAMSEDIQVKGVLDHIEPTGAQNYLKVRVDGQIITATDLQQSQLQSQQPIELAIAHKNLHFFANTAHE
ncbi:ABC transporter ATP-binding protein [Polycladidibacter stylochi]|uniref:ABC transporter ATP-binding protein n=1 Tax=Polycladidibacter stylochi TaxID=1807766 RepID=UPI000830FB6D|nr:sn-glycerol-3-phosphate ABC transporter ATP-binding protein UgpC [Pseudovibrio stylochi]